VAAYGQGYKNQLVFLKITENRWNWTGPNLKIAKNIVHCFKISEKDKNQQNICKKN
jgi:dTDP-4-dehydrorhamnose 3,5-epimerase-like enzyme